MYRKQQKSLQTVITPAVEPIPKVSHPGKLEPGTTDPCASCFRVEYEENRTAELDPWRNTYLSSTSVQGADLRDLNIRPLTTGPTPLYKPRYPSSAIIVRIALFIPLNLGTARFESSIILVLHSHKFPVRDWREGFNY